MIEELKEILKNARLHAPYFCLDSNKFEIEEDVVHEWIAARYPDSESPFLSIKTQKNPNDPPDVILMMKDKKRLGIEVTEFVDTKTIQNSIKNPDDFTITPKDYNEAEFRNLIRERICEKSQKPFKQICDLKILIIYSDEPFIDAKYLIKFPPVSQNFFDEIWFMMPPEPNTSGKPSRYDHCQLFEIKSSSALCVSVVKKQNTPTTRRPQNFQLSAFSLQPFPSASMTLIEDLQWRGLLADCTDLDGLSKRLAEGPVTLYCGFDPTGDSLHVGHLMGQLTLRRFQLAGNHVLALAGGATGMIGDPSGRSSERNLITQEQLTHNVACIKKQLARLLDFDAPANPARMVDNADWIRPITFLDFLRDVGKYFSINTMLAKDSVKSRMEGDHGISYTEFSYQLLQANDFLHLRKEYNCELQIGGSDQWGNITAGTDYIRKKSGLPVYGWTFPLITKSDGTKFGKSVGGAVWLDPEKTSPYKLYQFFINTEDVMVISYLKKFTFLPRAEIEGIEAKHNANPGAREAHKALAAEVTKIVHGQAALDAAIKASQILFGAEIGDTTETTFNDVVGEVPTQSLDRAKLEGAGTPLTELLVHAKLTNSKGQARKDIEGGGIYLNNQRIADSARAVTAADLLYGKHLLLRKGKRTYTVLTAA